MAGVHAANPTLIVVVGVPVRSWLGKIEAVKKLLVDQAPEQKPELDALAVAYVYLQWIGTGGRVYLQFGSASAITQGHATFMSKC